jgi:hypothetical protein
LIWDMSHAISKGITTFRTNIAAAFIPLYM